MVRFSRNMSLEDRECPCDECEFNQEGYCIADLEYSELDWEGYLCDCKSNNELITEEEYEEAITNGERVF